MKETMRHSARLLTQALFALCAAAPLAASAQLVSQLTPPTAGLHTGADHLPWTRSASIYEINVRQYSKEGTFTAVSNDLGRIKAMGVDILWLMPINPIGERNRKGPLGSYYAVKDYTAVNPEFGTLNDLRALVQHAHRLGMHVILDWVGNHTAWDNPWATEHPDWYKKNAKGEIYAVTFNNEAGGSESWTDVIGLDFNQKVLWDGMTDAMAYWVREADVDGFRCDASGLVPTAFWDHARAELDKIKPMFMLAEWNEPELHEHAFDMTYAWDLADVLKKIGKGKAGADDLRAWVSHPPKSYPRSAYRMLFTNNHDINTWDGTDGELYGPAYQAMAVLTFTLPGMPLIYDGQETGLSQRLEFFKKDTINWNKNSELPAFYTGLISLKKHNPALWNGQYGGDITLLDAGNPQVFAFQRQLEANLVRVVVNISGTPQNYALPGEAHPAPLNPWAWRIIAPEH